MNSSGDKRGVRGAGHFDKNRRAVGATPAHAVQHQAVKVDVEIGRRAKAQDQRHSAAIGLLGLQSGLIEQQARADAVHQLQHRRHQLGLCRQQQAKRDGLPNLANPHPLAHRHVRK